MKSKQKRKRGADRYSLDIYTPLSRSECIDRLREGKRGDPDIRFSMRGKGTKLIIWLRGPWNPIPYCRFEGHVEPYVAGTHIYGRLDRTGRMSIGVLMALMVWMLGAAIAAGSSKTDVVGQLYYFFALGGLPLCAFIMILGTSLEKYGPRRRKHFLRWIDEQLNVEAADEIETEA